MFKQPHPESLITKKKCSLVVLPIICVFLSMVTYNASTELNGSSSMNDTLEKLANSGINMCNNTYEYICSSFPSSSQSDKEQNEKQLLDVLYAEPFEGHQLLQLAKKMFRNCQNDILTEDQEDWYVVSEIVNDLGGWPVVQNASRVNWNSSIFNWIDTICKLRKLGIPSVLLKLSVIPNPKKENPKNETDSDKKYPLLKLDIISNNYYERSEILENKMVHLVRMFQLFQPHNVVIDEPKVREAYHRVVEFAGKLDKFIEDLPKDSPSYITTIEEIGEETVPIDWLKLLNGLAGRSIILNDLIQIAIPKERKLKKFIKFITDVPKEVLANYIIWTVVYELVPYLYKEVRDAMEIKTGKSFCLAEVEKRFELSPMSIMIDKKYFPPAFRADINTFIKDLKDSAIEFVQRRTLIRNVNETQMIVNEIEKLKVQIARPEEYYNMGELDARLAPELRPPISPKLTASIRDGLAEDLRNLYKEKRRFLTLVLLANRINDVVMFKKVLQQGIVAIDLEYLKSSHIRYLRKRNIIFVPRVVFQRLYNNELPKYMNWARLGTTILSSFFNKFKEHMEYRLENNYREIMEERTTLCINRYLLTVDQPRRHRNIRREQRLGVNSAKRILAGEAVLWRYRTQELGQNILPTHLSADYTPKKVFWILMASTFCYQRKHYDNYGTEMMFYIMFGNCFFKDELMSSCSSDTKMHMFDNIMEIYDARKKKISKS